MSEYTFRPDSLARKLDTLTTFPIVPVVDKFELVARKSQKGRVLAVIKNPVYKDIRDVFQWAKSNLGGDWHVPTLHVAGMDWQINPKATLNGWLWLIIKI